MKFLFKTLALICVISALGFCSILNEPKEERIDYFDGGFSIMYRTGGLLTAEKRYNSNGELEMHKYYASDQSIHVIYFDDGEEVIHNVIY